MNNWSVRTMQLAVGMMGIGFLMVVLAWNGAAGWDTPEQQIPYLMSGAIPGIGLIVAGLTLALVQEMRKSVGTVVLKMDELIAAQVVTDGANAVGGPTGVPTDGSAVVAGTTTYHLPDCRLVAGRGDLQTMAPQVATGRGLAPCRICEPADTTQAV